MSTVTHHSATGKVRIPLLLAAALLVGCGDNRPVHQDLADSVSAATLVGQQSTYVEEVDGKQVPSAKTVTYNGAAYAGGNTVRVSPGKHRLRVYTAGSQDRASGLWEFNFSFEPGHTYELLPASETAVSLQVRDRSTGKAVPVG
jgi:hypothetical protein